MTRLTSICFAVLIGLVFLAPVVAQDSPKIIRGGVVNGKALNLPKPEYPAEARAAGVEGTVYVDVMIDESGAVVSAVAATDTRKSRRLGIDAEVDVPPADPILRDAAQKAALEAKFSPTMLVGVPVRISGTLIYNFVAREPSSLNGGILNGKATSLPKPVYPEAALAVKAEGTVVVQITIDESGMVISAEAVSGHPLLRAAAVDAARLATFAPTRLSGQPVKVSGVVTYNFVAAKEDTN